MTSEQTADASELLASGDRMDLGRMHIDGVLSATSGREFMTAAAITDVLLDLRQLLTDGTLPPKVDL